MALDLVQLTVSKRRNASALFERIKNRLYEEEPRVFEKLRGCFVYIDFGIDGQRGNALPFRRSETAYIEELINNLATFEVDPEKWPKGELQRHLPNLNKGASEGGAGFMIAPLGDSVPATPFFFKMAFEMGLAFYTRHSIKDAWLEIHRRVHDHDKPEIQELLISAGASNEQGLTYPSDEVITNLALENPLDESLIAPRHIKAVYVHIWSTGAIWRIFPHSTMLTKGIFQGFTPGHHSIRKAETSPGSKEGE